jgi:sulfite exporter TauE/SafE
MDLLAALTLGLLGSMHCIGMCGPLALAVPSAAKSRWMFLAERVVFNAGKAMTYGAMGAVLGVIGKGVMMNVQQELSVIVGALMLLTALIPLGFRSAIERYSPLKYLYTFVKSRFSHLMGKRGMVTLFLMGVLNGLLPCGLVYTALVGATVVADVWQSALFMMVFGVGTSPALIAVALTRNLVPVRFRSILNRALPVTTIAVALLLILRGLNLGIPMVSPKVEQAPVHQQQEPTMECCEE